ncbi:MAG: hypothetical protein VX527_01925 [Planctomycetota bacterium]|nr:hypothetical protein [Planctomycetota bacterium]
MNKLILCGFWYSCLFSTVIASDPWADTVVDWQPGIGGVPGYDNPSSVLGPPETYSGEGVDPGVVSPFQPAWGPDEIISLGAGGSLVLRFDEWIENDPNNLHGIDLIVFGNAGFIDGGFPFGVVNGLFGADGGELSLSVDGQTWHSVPGCMADDAWPTLAWLDADPYDDTPGLAAANPMIPMDPNSNWTDLIGSGWDAVLEAYGQSAGGVGIDLADIGLERARYVRINVLESALLSPEIDAVVDVPPALPADLDGDGFVDVSDLLLLLASWGPVDPGHPGDLDDNGIVDVTDLLLLLEGWTP